jgi:hypothetical protein
MIDISWETTTMTNIGLDLGFFNNKLEFVFDYYVKNTTDILNGLFPTFEDAQAYPVAQFGRLQGGDIRYIDQLTVDTDGDGIPDAGDGIINNDDYVAMGNTIPRYTYSLDFALQYKGFDLGLFFQGVGKRDGYLRGDLAWAFNNAGKVQQWQKDGMWQEGQTNAAYPRMFIAGTNNITPSTFWVQDASYLRLKNLTVGYDLPQKWLSKVFVSKAQIYFSGENLWELSNRVGPFDPEAAGNTGYGLSAGSGTTGGYAFQRVYSVGLNLTF